MTEQRLFSNQKLIRLIIPLVIEQALTILVGMCDGVMVSSVGEAAISGVSLVDMINNVILVLFAALATGGAVVTSQFLGARQGEKARQSAGQLVLMSAVLGVAAAALCLVFAKNLMRLFFGSIDDDVMAAGLTYLHITALSFPFIALYNAGAAIFRSVGNSKVSMQVSLLMNGINVVGNAICIFVLKMGVAGVAVPTVVSRCVAAVVILLLAAKPKQELCLQWGAICHADGKMMSSILRIGVPNACENSFFQLGRLIVVSMIALFGTVQTSANAVANTLDGMGIIIGQATEYYTSHSYKPTQKIAGSAQTGPATVIIAGVGSGMISTAIPVLTIGAAIILAYLCAIGFDMENMMAPMNMSLGLYGIGIAAVGMLSTLGITLATDAYGPIADNAGGNAEMSGLGPEVRKRTDALDALGNTTAATGKGFAIGSAALTALALLASYIEEIRIGLLHNGITMLDLPNGTSQLVEKASILDFMEYYQVTLMNPTVLIGIFIGAMMSFLFCGLTMNAVGRAAESMVNEVRRQFREIKGILTGEGTPDYARCVEISTRGAQREMMFPSLLAIVVPVAVGLVFGVAGVMGLLVGGLSSGFVLAVFMANAGGAWDNAKKMVEEGHFGGKGSECHKATVVGDTVGDPFKDTSGPSLNILIKLMSMVSIVMAGLTVACHLF